MRLVYGMGFNDADYMVQPRINGKKIVCPFYRKWNSMLERCYSSKYHEIRPTYIGCSVIKKWLLFSNFRKWMINQSWKGKELDKDILFFGNKEYSPEKCIFVSSHVNTLLTDCSSSRGDYPIGVCFDKASGKYKAYLRYNGKQKTLGYFTNPKDAHIKYCKAKYKHILDIAGQQSDPKIKVGLIRHANLLIRATA